MTLRIVIDARELGGHPTGVGRYLQELLGAWAAAPYATGAECLLVSPNGPPAGRALPEGPGAKLRWVQVGGAGGTVWQQWTLARTATSTHADALFCPAYSSPVWCRVPVVLALHDVSFCAHPEWFSWRHGMRMRTLARLSAKRADAIVTLSRFSAGEIARHLRPPVEPHVIPLAVDYRHPPLPDLMMASDGLARPARVLFVGTILQRRHLPLLLEAFARARTVVGELTLDVIGANRTHPRQDLPALAASLGVDSAVRFLEYVDDATLAAAYCASSTFAYLSSYEGFGLPPLEAMQAGLATVVLDTPVAREVYRDGAAFVPPGDVEQVAARLVTLARDDGARAALVARGRAVAASYSWDDTAAHTWEVLMTAARTRP